MGYVALNVSADAVKQMIWESSIPIHFPVLYPLRTSTYDTVIDTTVDLTNIDEIQVHWINAGGSILRLTIGGSVKFTNNTNGWTTEIVDTSANSGATAIKLETSDAGGAAYFEKLTMWASVVS